MQQTTQYRNLRRVILSIGMLTNIAVLQAQIKPDASQTTPAASGTTAPFQAPDYTTGTLVNYVRTWAPQQPSTDESYITDPGRTVNQVNITTQYVDGLGRPLQSINWQASPNKQDMVMPVVYDAYGREQYKFLPYTSPTASASGNPGQFKMSPFSEQNSFYTGTYKSEQPAYTNEQYFYGKTNFEASPLNRVASTFAPGNSWAGSEGGSAEKKMSMQYLVNTAANDAIRIWNIDFNTNIDNNIPYTSAVYDDGQLYKNVGIDEAGNAMVEYKDKEGHVILKKVQIDNTMATDFSGYAGFLCTYYVYDDLGQLRTVVQPKAVAPMAAPNGSWVLDAPTVKELCFRYEYDERHRMIAKKVPGAGWINIVYDVRDRPVFTQDANMRLRNQWMYTLYDELNRPVQTGIMVYAGNAAALKAAMPGTASTSVPATGTTANTVPATLLINNRDFGRTTYQATTSIIFDQGFTSENNGSFTAQIGTEAAQTFNNSQSSSLYPIPVSGATLYPLTYTFYDDYTATNKTYNTANNAKLGDGTSNNSNANAEAVPTQNSAQTLGLPTVTKVIAIEDPNNLSSGKWLETAVFYDDKGRTVQTQHTNYKGGNDITTSRYDFTGKIISNYTVHNNASGNIANLSINTTMTYDHESRLLTTTKSINDDDTNNKRTIVRNTYDALGQLKNKQTGQKSVSDGTAAEDDNYNYNIRGWLKGINYYGSGGAYSSQMNISSNKWFSMDLSYDWGFGSNQFNGNIAGTRWKTAGSGQERAYGFAYDAANRLLKGDFTVNSGSWATDPIIDFSMSMGINPTASTSYDENGNIKAMVQKGIVGVSNATIDNLTYSYFPNTNKLNTVSELSPVDNKVGDFSDNNTTGNDYGYDVNGNLVTDLNKRISAATPATGIDLTTGGAIIYNHLNLPWQIAVKNADGSAKGTITYIYDASGNKLEKRTIEFVPGATNILKQTYTAYLGGFEYEDNKLQFFGMEEGRIRYNQYITNTDNTAKTSYVYDYFIKDHLGNTRTVLTDDQNTLDAYPEATLEASTLVSEKIYYTIPDDASTRVNKSTINNYPSDNSTSPNDFIQKLNGNGTKIGTSILLKVMAGDQFNVKVSSWYKTNNASPQSPQSPLNDLATLLINSILASPGAAGDGFTQQGLQNSGIVSPNITSFLNDGTKINPVAGRPKAYLNWILFDEQLKYVASSSGADQVPDESAFGIYPNNIVYPQIRTNLPIDKNGFLYVYVSNETPNIDVFFDNLQVTHVRGPLLEETSYYPFGLTMAGISSNAAGLLENKVKFQKQELQHEEFSDGSGLETYEFKYRMDDPQTGRFWQLDPLASKYVYNSTYAFSENKVINAIELEGLESVPTFKKVDNENRGESTQIKPPISCFGCSHAQETPAFTLTVSEGAQAGLKVAGFGGEINGGSKEIFRITDIDPGSNSADNSSEITGKSLSFGVVSGSSESTSNSTNSVDALGIPVKTTTTETTNKLLFGIKNTPLSVGVQNQETTVQTDQPGSTPVVTQRSGPHLAGLGSSSDIENKTGGGTTFAIIIIIKFEIKINIPKVLSNIFDSFNTGH